jgi:hypothetical protein
MFNIRVQLNSSKNSYLEPTKLATPAKPTTVTERADIRRVDSKRYKKVRITFRRCES